MSDGSVQSNKSRLQIEELRSALIASQDENQFILKNLENAYSLLKEHKEVLSALCEEAGIEKPKTEISGDEMAQALAEKEHSEAEKAEMEAFVAEQAAFEAKKLEFEALQAAMQAKLANPKK